MCDPAKRAAFARTGAGGAGTAGVGIGCGGAAAAGSAEGSAYSLAGSFTFTAL
jgi:hypothetical protein